jgi:hypothetical protein
MFENRVVWGICGHKEEEIQEDRKNYVMRNFIISTLHQICLGWSNEEG